MDSSVCVQRVTSAQDVCPMWTSVHPIPVLMAGRVKTISTNIYVIALRVTPVRGVSAKWMSVCPLLVKMEQGALTSTQTSSVSVLRVCLNYVPLMTSVDPFSPLLKVFRAVIANKIKTTANESRV
jgi:hypothetical protein